MRKKLYRKYANFERDGGGVLNGAILGGILLG
jgi:hypothetical protein